MTTGIALEPAVASAMMRETAAQTATGKATKGRIRQARAAGGVQGAFLEATREMAASRADRMRPAEKKKLAEEPPAAAWLRAAHLAG